MAENWRDLSNAPAPGTVLASLDDLADGGALFWESGDGKDAFRLILLRSGDEVFGYVNRCAHFGVRLAEKPEQLLHVPHRRLTCNVHYAHYRWRDGTCESGECDGEGLLAVPLAVAAGKILIGD